MGEENRDTSAVAKVETAEDAAKTPAPVLPSKPKAAPAVKEEAPAPSAPVESAKPVAHDGLSEIERRRQAMIKLKAQEPPKEEPEAKKPKQESGAMKQGLQAWAEKVNALAGTDAELVKACREFVRKRIL